MRKHVFIIGIILFCVACKHNQCRKENVTINEVNSDPLVQLFVSETVQDTLISFLSVVDSIPNPYGAPTMYILICEKVQKDTIIRFITYPGLIERISLDNSTSKDDLGLHIKGGCEINSKIVVVYYDGFDDLKNLVNEEYLSKSFVEEHDFFKKYKGDRYEYSYYPISEWSYKLLDSKQLKLIKKQKGRQEEM